MTPNTTVFISLYNPLDLCQYKVVYICSSFLATETQPGVSSSNNPSNPHFIDTSLLIPSISISGTSRKFTPALCSGPANLVSPNQCVMHPQYPHLLNEILPDESSHIYDLSFEPSATVTTRSDRGRRYIHPPAILSPDQVYPEAVSIASH